MGAPAAASIQLCSVLFCPQPRSLHYLDERNRLETNIGLVCGFRYFVWLVIFDDVREEDVRVCRTDAKIFSTIVCIKRFQRSDCLSLVEHL